MLYGRLIRFQQEAASSVYQGLTKADVTLKSHDEEVSVMRFVNFS
jgi:hypothetical protein